MKWGGKKRQIEEEVGRQQQEMTRPGVRQVQVGNGEQSKMQKTGFKAVRGALRTLVVKGLVKVNVKRK